MPIAQIDSTSMYLLNACAVYRVHLPRVNPFQVSSFGREAFSQRAGSDFLSGVLHLERVPHKRLIDHGYFMRLLHPYSVFSRVRSAYPKAHISSVPTCTRVERYFCHDAEPQAG